MTVKVTRKPSPPTQVRILTSTREMSCILVVEDKLTRVLVHNWAVHGGSCELLTASSFAYVELREWCEAVIEMIDGR